MLLDCFKTLYEESAHKYCIFSLKGKITQKWKFGLYLLTMMQMGNLGKFFRKSTKHFWSLIAKHHCSNHCRWRPVLKMSFKKQTNKKKNLGKENHKMAPNKFVQCNLSLQNLEIPEWCEKMTYSLPHPLFLCQTLHSSNPVWSGCTSSTTRRSCKLRLFSQWLPHFAVTLQKCLKWTEKLHLSFCHYEGEHYFFIFGWTHPLNV